MLVADLMTPDPVTVSMDATVLQIRELFNDRRFHHLIVVEHDQIVGVVSDRDLLGALSPFIGKRDERTADERLLHRHAHQIMSRNPICVTPGTLVEEAAAILLAHRISCLPVIDGHRRPVGIITWRDLISWSLTRMAQARAA